MQFAESHRHMLTNAGILDDALTGVLNPSVPMKCVHQVLNTIHAVLVLVKRVLPTRKIANSPTSRAAFAQVERYS